MKKFSILIPNNSFQRVLLIISLFILAAFFVPAGGLIFLIFLPVLILFYSAVAGQGKTAAAFLIPFLSAALLSHLLQLNAPYLIVFMMGIVGFTAAAIALKKASIEKVILFPAAVIIGFVCVYFIYAGMDQSVNPWRLVEQFVAQTIEQNISLYSQLPLDKEDIKFIKDNKQALINVFTDIFPALVIVGSAIIVWINILMSKNMLSKVAITLPGLAGLSLWKAPEFIIWIFLTAGGLLIFPNDQMRFFALNVFLIICFIYFLQGFAIISFFFQNKNVPIFLRYLFYFLIAVQQFLMIPIAVAGLFDMWIDFRKFLRNDQASA